MSASLHFIPAALLSYPTYRGLYVESALQLADPSTGRPTGQCLSSVPLGSVVALTVQVTSPDDLGPVTLTILIPGGLEPLDPNLETGGGGVGGGSCAAALLADVPWSSFWPLPMCPAQVSCGS